MTVRIQRQRTKGWRMPPGAVYVGRPTEGRSGVVRVEYVAEDKPVVFRSTDLDEWIMPVRLGTPEP